MLDVVHFFLLINSFRKIHYVQFLHLQLNFDSQSHLDIRVRRLISGWLVCYGYEYRKWKKKKLNHLFSQL